MEKEKVSIIIPVYNCEDFIVECLKSIDNQVLKSTDMELEIEVSIFDDASQDTSLNLINKWTQTTHLKNIIISRNDSSSPKGVGYARNRAIQQSTGQYLCFCDADDIMEPERVIRQCLLAVKNPNAIIGSRFKREPKGSTEIFTFWANNLKECELTTQIYLTFGPSLVMPTWFCHRKVFERVPGGFDETGKGTPEDLIFFYKHLDNGHQLVRADEPLVMYRYHLSATTFSVSDAIIEKIRLERLETKVLSKWDTFSIWNAGKKGRKFYRALNPENQNKVQAFCDVDDNKINKKTYHPHPLEVKIPIIHARIVVPPIIICVKTELMWDESFRNILDSLNLTEGKDFFYFN